MQFSHHFTLIWFSRSLPNLWQTLRFTCSTERHKHKIWHQNLWTIKKNQANIYTKPARTMTFTSVLNCLVDESHRKKSKNTHGLNECRVYWEQENEKYSSFWAKMAKINYWMIQICNRICFAYYSNIFELLRNWCTENDSKSMYLSK